MRRECHTHRSFAGWLDRYDRAGLAQGERPPDALRMMVQRAQVIVASDMIRAEESAALLAGDREVIPSPLLREAKLEIPACFGLRLPLFLWGPIIGLRWKRSRVKPDAKRGGEAAAWLASLAREHGTVAAITHGAIRRTIADALLADQWTCALPKRDAWREWSVWDVTP